MRILLYAKRLYDFLLQDPLVFSWVNQYSSSHVISSFKFVTAIAAANDKGKPWATIT